MSNTNNVVDAQEDDENGEHLWDDDEEDDDEEDDDEEIDDYLPTVQEMAEEYEQLLRKYEGDLPEALEPPEIYQFSRRESHDRYEIYDEMEKVRERIGYGIQWKREQILLTYERRLRKFDGYMPTEWYTNNWLDMPISGPVWEDEYKLKDAIRERLGYSDRKSSYGTPQCYGLAMLAKVEDIIDTPDLTEEDVRRDGMEHYPDYAYLQFQCISDPYFPYDVPRKILSLWIKEWRAHREYWLSRTLRAEAEAREIRAARGVREIEIWE